MIRQRPETVSDDIDTTFDRLAPAQGCKGQKSGITNIKTAKMTRVNNPPTFK